MAQSHLEQYSIADFIGFRKEGRIDLNPIFQRRAVWSKQAKVYLIDTILRQMPIPKVYLRTTIDPETQTLTRDVVDGQQRLRAVFQFAEGDLRLTSRAKEFEGLRYEDLDDDLKNVFLSYTIGVEQLINADDQAVLEIFARLNSYTVTLNAAEKRHAKFQGDWKWTIHESARRWTSLWEELGVLSVTQQARMLDDQLFAEMFLVVTQGVTGGEARVIDAAYKHFERHPLENLEAVSLAVDTVLEAVTKQLRSAIEGSIASPPHFLLVFAATAFVLEQYALHPLQQLPTMDEEPERPEPPSDRDEWEAVADALIELGQVVDHEEPGPDDPDLRRFWAASRGGTVAIASRSTRFPFYVESFQS